MAQLSTSSAATWLQASCTRAGEPTDANVVKHLVQDWSREPYSQGSYSQRKADAERLAEPVAGRLYFAGEAMNPNGKTIAVHGACESAYIAVEAMLA